MLLMIREAAGLVESSLRPTVSEDEYYALEKEFDEGPVGDTPEVSDARIEEAFLLQGQPSIEVSKAPDEDHRMPAEDSEISEDIRPLCILTEEALKTNHQLSEQLRNLVGRAEYQENVVNDEVHQLHLYAAEIKIRLLDEEAAREYYQQRYEEACQEADEASRELPTIRRQLEEAQKDLNVVPRLRECEHNLGEWIEYSKRVEGDSNEFYQKIKDHEETIQVLRINKDKATRNLRAAREEITRYEFNTQRNAEEMEELQTQSYGVVGAEAALDNPLLEGLAIQVGVVEVHPPRAELEQQLQDSQAEVLQLRQELENARAQLASTSKPSSSCAPVIPSDAQGMFAEMIHSNQQMMEKHSKALADKFSKGYSKAFSEGFKAASDVMKHT